MRTLAGLSKSVDVILTTHSINIIDEISNLLRVKNLSADEKKKLGYEEWEVLSQKI